MDNRGHHTYQEILEQPAAWADALAAFAERKDDLLSAWDEAAVSRVLVTGCGSTYYLSEAAALLLSSLAGVPAAAVPASEIVLFPDTMLADAENTLLLTISRSGTTTETIRAQHAFRSAGGRANWCITCYPSSPLALDADVVLPAEAAQEQSIAQTRSFASMLLLSMLTAATIAGLDTESAVALPSLGEQLLSDAEPLMADLGARAHIDRVYFLGSGYQHAVAAEAMLKMTEMSLTFSGAFHFMEFRHGPMSMAGDSALIAGLLSQTGFAAERQVLSEMQALGATTLALNPTAELTQSDFSVDLPQNVPDWQLPLLFLPPLQVLAYYRAMSRGLDPDNPRNLTAVVYLDGEEAG